MATVHIIGAGIAGLTAASELVRHGHYVQVYEASSAAGGRCKLLQDEKNSGFDGCHALLFGASRHIRAQAQALGSAHTLLDMGPCGDSFDTKAGQYRHRNAFLLPPSLPLIDMAQLVATAYAAPGELLARRFDYYHPLAESYIEPVGRCLTFSGADHADARLFARRLAYLLRKGPKGVRLMLPRHSLYQSLVAPSLDLIEREGSAIYYGQQVKRLTFEHGRITGFDTARQKRTLREDEYLVLALPAPALAALMPGHLPLNSVDTRDILSVVYTAPELQDARMLPLARSIVDWVRVQDGRIIATSYAPRQLLQQENSSLARRIWREIAPLFALSARDMPAARVVKERKAITRLNALPALPDHCFFAGEAFAPSYLQPLDAAIASGMDVAYKIRMRIER